MSHAARLHGVGTLFSAPSLTTPPLSFSNEFWVRITNGCGSVDSENATVNVNP